MTTNNHLLLRCLIMLFTPIVVTTGCTRQNPPDQEKTPNTQEVTHVTPSAGTDKDSHRLYCEEHAAYEDECFICHPEFREKGRLWCREHDRYEDRCFECHPELEDPKRVLCEKHFLFEDECFLCQPDLRSGSQRPAGAAAP